MHKDALAHSTFITCYITEDDIAVEDLSVRLGLWYGGTEQYAEFFVEIEPGVYQAEVEHTEIVHTLWNYWMAWIATENIDPVFPSLNPTPLIIGSEIDLNWDVDDNRP